MAIIAKKVPPLRRTLHLLYEPLQRRQHLHEHILTYSWCLFTKSNVERRFLRCFKEPKDSAAAFTDIRTGNSAVESTRRQLAKLPVPFQKSNLNRLHSPHLAAQHSTVINHMGQKKLCANGRSPVACKRVRAKGCWFQGLCEASCHFVHLFYIPVDARFHKWLGQNLYVSL